MFYYFFAPPSFSPLIPSIRTGMEDNPAKRNRGFGEQEAEECARGKPSRRNSSVTCGGSGVDGQQELFPHEFALSFPHFSSPPTFSTLFLCLPLGALPPFHIPPPLFSLKPFTSSLSSSLHFRLRLPLNLSLCLVPE